MSSRRLVKQVYAHSRARYDAGQSNRWCKYTHALMKQLGMEEIWLKAEHTQEEEKKWEGKLKEEIYKKEEKEWKDRLNTKPKLRTYKNLKQTLTFEDSYLSHHDRQAREVMTRLRGGTNELRIETGRYPNTNRDRRLEIHERRCLLCLSGEVEDEKHFVLDCVMYEDLREKMFEVVKRVLLKKEETIEEVMNDEAGKQRIFAGLLGEGAESSAQLDLRNAALAFCKRAMKRRNGVVVGQLDQRT